MNSGPSAVSRGQGERGRREGDTKKDMRIGARREREKGGRHTQMYRERGRKREGEGRERHTERYRERGREREGTGEGDTHGEV